MAFLEKIRKAKLLSTRTKLGIFSSNVRPILSVHVKTGKELKRANWTHSKANV